MMYPGEMQVKGRTRASINACFVPVYSALLVCLIMINTVNDDFEDQVTEERSLYSHPPHPAVYHNKASERPLEKVYDWDDDSHMMMITFI